MTHLFRQLRKLQAINQPIRIAVVGAGFMGRGLVHQLRHMPGVFPSLVVNRSVEHAVEAYRLAGFDPQSIVLSDSPRRLSHAVERGQPAVTAHAEMAAAVTPIDVVIEATGAVEYGAAVALWCIEQRKHFVSLNAETDATVGCALKKKADKAGVIYTNADGDQPAVLMRLIEYCQGCGFDVRCAVNCKGFLDLHATPDSILAWAAKQNTSPRMTAAFTDGTKMNIEQNVICNAAGLVPLRRGMTGVRTDLKNALKDFLDARALGELASVDYTLGGDFGGGVFVIARSEHPQMVKPYLRYLKMGDGPLYLFFRPYHLCHMETPLSAAEAVLYREPTIAPLGAPRAHTIALAKRHLPAGTLLDGIGGFTVYGQVEEASKCAGLLPVGLAEDVRLIRDVMQDEPIPLDAVELDESRLIVKLWTQQERMAAKTMPAEMVDSPL